MCGCVGVGVVVGAVRWVGGSGLQGVRGWVRYGDGGGFWRLVVGGWWLALCKWEWKWFSKWGSRRAGMWAGSGGGDGGAGGAVAGVGW